MKRVHQAIQWPGIFVGKAIAIETLDSMEINPVIVKSSFSVARAF